MAIGAALCVTPFALFVLPWQAGALIGWDAAGLAFLIAVWMTIHHLDPTETQRLAVREDPSAPIVDGVVVVAGLACLGAVGLVLVKAASSAGATKAVLIAIALLSVAVAWACVHTVFTLRYARIFYRADPHGGIDFSGDKAPDYLDFAYVAFTVGLTFQVSDTDLTSKQMRRVVLRHAMISFLFGAVMVGLTINVVASLLR